MHPRILGLTATGLRIHIVDMTKGDHYESQRAVAVGVGLRALGLQTNPRRPKRT